LPLRVGGTGRAARRARLRARPPAAAAPAPARRQPAAADLADELAERVLHRLRRLLLGAFLVLDQREQRVALLVG
jgi:hypothetical protein